MKTTLLNLLAGILFAVSLQTQAQGLVYDQQSATGPKSPPPDDFFNIQEDSPLMQSFIPTFSAIGFVQFEFWDIANNGTNGATVYVNLWSGSPNPRLATLLGSTTPVYMPNGFVNDGLVYAGITNFYFSASVTITPGQIYYLQPVVLSGDDPWDIALVSDTYPNGQLFEKGVGFSSDLWFREGVVSVPEPSVLVLVGMIALVVGFKRHSTLIVLLSLSVIPLLSFGQDSVVQATADEAGLSRISGTTLSPVGTFWVMTVNADGTLIQSPYPFLPSDLSALPIYPVAGTIFMVDNTGGQLAPASAGRQSKAQTVSIMQAQAQTVANLIEQIQLPGTNDDNGTNQTFQSNFIPHSYGSNDLWLSVASVSNGVTQLVIHEPENDLETNWDLLYTTNIATPFSNWWWI